MIRKPRTRGFTLIEVMFTLLIFMVAITGLVSLQRVSSDGAHRGKRMTAAVSVANYFVSQIQTELAAWKHDVAFPATTFPINQYPLLTAAIGTGGGGTNTWLAVDTENFFRIDQYMGHSSLDTDSDGTSRFCVNYMIGPAETDPSADTNDNFVVWRTHVRVSWPKGGYYQSSDGWKDCTPDSVELRLVDERSDDAIELVSVLSREFSR